MPPCWREAGRRERALPGQTVVGYDAADVAALLLGRAGDGAVWRSERELRDGGGADWLPKGCVPDGVLELREGGALRRLAVEVEVSRKDRWRYAAKLARYRRALDAGGLDQVRWYVPAPTDAQWLRREALLPAGFPAGDERMVVALLPEHSRCGR